MEDDIQVDMTSALAAMDDDFGGGDGDEGSLPSSPSPEASPAPTSSGPAPAPAVSAQPWDAPPKSWKQDHHPHWQKFDPTIRQYIHEREKQALDGIMQYKSAYDPYAALEKQYKPWVDKYQMPLHQASSNLLSAHIALMEGTPDVKQQVLQNLLQYPGVKDLLSQMLGGQPGAQPSQPPAFDPRVVQQEVQKAVAPALSEVQAWKKAQEERELQESQKAVDAFLADPQNKYAKEAMPDMARLFQAGLAADLKSAYDQACRMNPTIYAKMLEEEIQKATQRPGPSPKVVRSGQTPPASTKQVDADEDMEATMRSALRDINSR